MTTFHSLRGVGLPTRARVAAAIPLGLPRGAQSARKCIEREIELARELYQTLVANVVTGQFDVSGIEVEDDEGKFVDESSDIDDEESEFVDDEGQFVDELLPVVDESSEVDDEMLLVVDELSDVDHELSEFMDEK